MRKLISPLIAPTTIVVLWIAVDWFQSKPATKYQVLEALYEYKREHPNRPFNYYSVQEIRTTTALPDSEWVDWFCRYMSEPEQGYLHRSFYSRDRISTPEVPWFSLTDSLGIDHFLSLRDQRRARRENRNYIYLTIVASLLGAFSVAYFTHKFTWRNIEKDRRRDRDSQQEETRHQEFKLLTAICEEMHANLARCEHFLRLREEGRSSSTRLSSNAVDLAFVDYTKACSSMVVLSPLLGFYRDIGAMNLNLDAKDWQMATNFVIDKIEAMFQSYNSVHTHWNDLRTALGVDPFPSLTPIDEEKIVNVVQRAGRLSSSKTV